MLTSHLLQVLGYYNRRGIDPAAFLKEIRFIASEPNEQHFFNVSDESVLKDIVDALGERIFSLEGQMMDHDKGDDDAGDDYNDDGDFQVPPVGGGASAFRWLRPVSPHI